MRYTLSTINNGTTYYYASTKGIRWSSNPDKALRLSSIGIGNAIADVSNGNDISFQVNVVQD